MLFGDEDDAEEDLNLGKTADIALDEDDKERSGASAGDDPQQEGVSSRLTNDLVVLDVVDLDYLDDYSDIDDTLVDGDGEASSQPQVLAAAEKPEKEQNEKPHVSLFFCWEANKLEEFGQSKF